VCLLDEPNFIAERVDDFHRFVRGAVVHDDDLMRRERLREQIGKRLADEHFPVLIRDDDADGGQRHVQATARR